MGTGPVLVVEVQTGRLIVGQTLSYRMEDGAEFRVRIRSMMMHHQPVESAGPGDRLGVELDPRDPTTGQFQHLAKHWRKRRGTLLG